VASWALVALERLSRAISAERQESKDYGTQRHREEGSGKAGIWIASDAHDRDESLLSFSPPVSFPVPLRLCVPFSFAANIL
jgi:hypothetical protein